MVRKRMGSGDPPGLQNRRAAGFPVAGAFDSHTLPPKCNNNCYSPIAEDALLQSRPDWRHIRTFRFPKEDSAAIQCFVGAARVLKVR